MHEGQASLQTQILRYLQHNTYAAETAEGVNSVWLGRPPTAEKLLEVERALDGLVYRGVLEKHRLPGGAAAYRRVGCRDSK